MSATQPPFFKSKHNGVTPYLLTPPLHTYNRGSPANEPALLSPLQDQQTEFFLYLCSNKDILNVFKLVNEAHVL